MRVLGIDPGFALVGFGIVEENNGRLKALDYGVISTPKEESISTRLAMIYKGMCDLIDTYKPDAIAIEELFFFKNQKTVIPVAEARGVIVLAGIQKLGNLYEYTPLQIKQALTGNGRAEKKQIQYMVTNILGLEKVPKPDDAADAVAVALTHLQTNNILSDNRI
ncbi:MAG: crossover junction endodeoxyribonuclease RuvC [Clostridia bacterium]|nr:crossover junction endodeoxyribonuclease RuvC [Clostridia bacterium]